MLTFTFVEDQIFAKQIYLSWMKFKIMLVWVNYGFRINYMDSDGAEITECDDRAFGLYFFFLKCTTSLIFKLFLKFK